MSERSRELKSAIERPLQYVRSGDRRRLRSVKNLSNHVLCVSREALAADLVDDDVHMFRSLQELFTGFDGLMEDEKVSRIDQALTLIGKRVSVPTENVFRQEEHPQPSLERLKGAHKKLSSRVQYAKGVGPAIASKLKRADIETVYDLLMFFPTRYEDRRTVTKIGKLEEGKKATVVGEIVFSGVAFYKGLRRRVFEVVVEDETGQLRLKWFRFPIGSFEEQFQRGKRIIVCGKSKLYRKKMEMHHPDFELQGKTVESLSFGRIIPVYREVGGLYQKTLRRILHQALNSFGSNRLCLIPPEICKDENIMPPWRAIRELHTPLAIPNPERRSAQERSLSFEELFFYCLSLGVRKRMLAKRPGISFAKRSGRVQMLRENLPFELTDAQKSVFERVQKDMVCEQPMNRLLQGDVGSGKTIVAFMTALHAIDNGYQVAFMAPTEILAEQHARSLARFAELVDVKMGTLLGSHSTVLRRETLKDLRDGKIDILIGTHAVLEKNVHFKSLGFVVVDEQHRFGVRQRATLRSKAKEPDVLVMSATPIPRTLALTLYGDLDVSILNQLPKGRKPIETRIFPEKNRKEVYRRVANEVADGRQAYVVYPLLEESDHLDVKDATSMAEELNNEIFPDFRVGLIHGQMKGAEKDKIMSAFGNGEIQILVSTTVIEVGIDVANATMMVIEHPERFGLSQLHQLRGRVGRGEEKSFCYLIKPPRITQLATERLETFAQIHDGFLLAEEDLRMRGPGDFFGVAQSGFPSFRVAVFPRDLDLLERARRHAFSLLDEDPEMKKASHKYLSWVIDTVWADRLALVRVG